MFEVALHAASDFNHPHYNSYCLKSFFHYSSRWDFLLKNFENKVCEEQFVPKFDHIQFFLFSNHHFYLQLIGFPTLFKILLAHQFSCSFSLGLILFVFYGIFLRLITKLFSKNLPLQIWFLSLKSTVVLDKVLVDKATSDDKSTLDPIELSSSILFFLYFFVYLD